MLDTVFWGNSVARWLIAGALLLASLVVGRLAGALVALAVRRAKARVVAEMARAFVGPVTVLTVILGVRIAAESLELAAAVMSLTTQGATFFSVLVLTWLAAQLYGVLHGSALEPYAARPESSVDIHLLRVLRTVVTALVWVVGGASALTSVGFEVSAILAGLGIGGMAVALAAQDSVANLFGGVLVLTQRPFRIGERIDIGGVDGWVQHVGLRTTRIRNWYGRDVWIPNKKFTDSVLTNIDSQKVYYQEVHLRLDPRSTSREIEQALSILADVVRENELLDKTPWIAFDRIQHGFFEIEFWYGITRWTRAESETIPNEYEKICRAKTRLNLEVLRRFEAAGLRLAVPLEIHLDQGGAPGPRA